MNLPKKHVYREEHWEVFDLIKIILFIGKITYFYG